MCGFSLNPPPPPPRLAYAYVVLQLKARPVLGLCKEYKFLLFLSFQLILSRVPGDLCVVRAMNNTHNPS